MSESSSAVTEELPWEVDRFADVKVLRYEVPGFETLDLRDKRLLYYLTEAALAGRDIVWDQNHAANLVVRKTNEAIIESGVASADPEFPAFMTWAKRVWFSGGIHHHYSTRKFTPGFSAEAFARWVSDVAPERLPLSEGQDREGLIAELRPLLFEPEVDGVRVEQRSEVDVVAGSSNNFYQGVTQAEVEAFYAARTDPQDSQPVSHGLNSQLVKGEEGLVERTWRVGGLYTESLEVVVAWLERALGVVESPAQRNALEQLINYYRSGDLSDFDRYNIAWLADTESRVDTINGFIETYGDSLGFRGTWEAIVSFRDLEATKRMQTIADNAAWFEARSPIMNAHKKDEVTGVVGTVITVTGAGGDSAPTLPLGVNLPNADWIRDQHGSKSVNLGNIARAHHEAGKGSGLLDEFCLSPAALDRAKAHGALASNLHTDLHEVIGHASGRLSPGVAEPNKTLKQYASTLEEARADLVGLYFLLDEHLVSLGLMPSLEVGRAAYDNYIRNGLMVQLARVKLGDTIEQAHMRNRQLVAKWALAHGDGAVVRVQEGGKTYFCVEDHEALRTVFGRLLKEIQRIKSEGDFEAGKALVETYGVSIERALHEEVLERYQALDLKPYSGFISPRLVPVEQAGEIVDVRVEYPTDFVAQMMRYGREYATLPPRVSLKSIP